MRIGTWNLDGRWSSRHADLLEAQACDIWLLTEVPIQASLTGYDVHLGATESVAGRRWAGVFSRTPLAPLPDPHPASAMAKANGLTVISTVLPWKGAGVTWPWAGSNTGQRAAQAVAQLLSLAPRTALVWGGDWNHALDGPEYAGSRSGRQAILDALVTLDLQVPTRELSAAGGGLSIDHVAVSSSVTIVSADPIEAAVKGARLSDHDAYVVEFAG